MPAKRCEWLQFSRIRRNIIGGGVLQGMTLTASIRTASDFFRSLLARLSEPAHLWFPVEEALTGGGDEGVAERGHAGIGLDAGLVQQRLGLRRVADRLQMAERIHHELNRRRLQLTTG
jgi:hypothetical protein